MDLLSNVLLSLEVEATIISSWHLSAPWGIDIADFEPGYCFNVGEGGCWFIPPSGAPQWLLPGDSLLAPRGGECAIVSEPGTPLGSLAEVWRQREFQGFENQGGRPLRVEWGGGGTQTRLLSLAFSFRERERNALLSALPEFIVLRGGDTGVFPSIQPATEFLLKETQTAQPGYFAMATQLAELIFLGLLRAHVMSESSHPVGWLRGLADSHIAKALTAMHAKPERPWTVPMLAQMAGMSRSAFAERFRGQVGQTPIDYLTDLRIRLAAQRLRSGRQPLNDVAQALGFQSDRVFRRVFKQRMGVAPLRFRNAGEAPGRK